MLEEYEKQRQCRLAPIAGQPAEALTSRQNNGNGIVRNVVDGHGALLRQRANLDYVQRSEQYVFYASQDSANGMYGSSAQICSSRVWSAAIEMRRVFGLKTERQLAAEQQPATKRLCRYNQRIAAQSLYLYRPGLLVLNAMTTEHNF